jgi:N-glycosidase YbiA
MAITKFREEYFFLSNFYPVQIKMDDIFYPSLEHAYQASKTLDEDERLMIRFASTPGKAKRMGKEITIRQDWDKVKVGIMKKLLEQKFSKPALKKMLLETGDEEIIEGNEWGDTFWGICNGEGSNILGKLLMEIRNANR